MLRSDPDAVSSALSRVEVVRAIRRSDLAADTEERANAILDRVALVGIDDAILLTAARLEPTRLRTLDAVHLATAMALGNDIQAIVSYDLRLAAAARRAGIAVLAPS